MSCITLVCSIIPNKCHYRERTIFSTDHKMSNVTQRTRMTSRVLSRLAKYMCNGRLLCFVDVSKTSFTFYWGSAICRDNKIINLKHCCKHNMTRFYMLILYLSQRFSWWLKMTSHYCRHLTMQSRVSVCAGLMHLKQLSYGTPRSRAVDV